MRGDVRAGLPELQHEKDLQWLRDKLMMEATDEEAAEHFRRQIKVSLNTRTTQLFINFKDNASLDKSGFAPFGEVTDGMDVVDKIYDGYGEGAPRGRGPDQGRLNAEGNAYLQKDFPKLDFIKSATIVP